MSSVFRYSILTTYSPYIVYVFREYSCLNSLFHTYSDDGFGVRFYPSEVDNISVFEGFGRQSVPTQRSLVADAVACVVTATTDGPPPIDDDERTAGAARVGRPATTPVQTARAMLRLLNLLLIASRSNGYLSPAGGSHRRRAPNGTSLRLSASRVDHSLSGRRNFQCNSQLSSTTIPPSHRLSV